MATGKPKFYWDSAPLIAWIKDEKRPDPSEMDGLAEVIELAERGKATIIMSVLWRSELMTGDLTQTQKKRLKEVFEYRLIEEVGVDSRVMDLAAEIRAYHKNDTKKSSNAKLKNVRVPDAIHLASAIHYEAIEFHTFDGKKELGGTAGLMTLDGNVGGRILKICAPRADQLRLDFGSISDDEKGEDDSEENPPS